MSPLRAVGCSGARERRMVPSLAMADAHLVAGRYRVTRILGSGFVAHVLAAVDERDGREVAIKVPRPRDEAGTALALLRREAEILSRVKNPHLPAFYAFSGDDEESAHLV